jgi:[ribosomal protein S5]-alanine N-acetyltransferase
MESLQLKTRRLLLTSATPEIASADLYDRSQFSRLLNAHIPDDWPPPLNDDNSKAFTLRYLVQNHDAAGWSTWYFLLPREGGGAEAIGIGGFKGKPLAGMVEIGYSILSQYQRQGLASEATEALVAWAFCHPDVQLVTAETLPNLVASIRVLEKTGFRYLGHGSEEGVVRYARRRPSGGWATLGLAVVRSQLQL